MYLSVVVNMLHVEYLINKCIQWCRTLATSVIGKQSFQILLGENNCNQWWEMKNYVPKFTQDCFVMNNNHCWHFSHVWNPTIYMFLHSSHFKLFQLLVPISCKLISSCWSVDCTIDWACINWALEWHNFLNYFDCYCKSLEPVLSVVPATTSIILELKQCFESDSLHLNYTWIEAVLSMWLALNKM